MDNTDNVYRELDVIWFFRMFQRGLREFCKYDVYNHLMYSGNASLDRNYPPLYKFLIKPDRKREWNYDFRVDYFHCFPVNPESNKVKELVDRLNRKMPKICLERQNYRWDYVKRKKKK